MSATTFDFEAERVNRGHTRDSLAREIKCSPESIRQIEAGKRPGPRLGRDYAEFFGFKYTDLWPLERSAA